MTRVVGYVRVSTEEQGESGLGLEAQRRAIESACDQRGWEPHLREEVGSAASVARRPILKELLGELRRGDVLLVAKLDRLSRSVIDFAGLLADARRRGFNLIALDFGLDLSTPQGELVANVLMAVAQWERQMISQRTSAAMRVKVARGWKPHRPTRAIPAAVRKRIVRLHRAGVSQRGIADTLNRKGVPAVGARWHRGTVIRVLDQEQATA